MRSSGHPAADASSQTWLLFVPAVDSNWKRYAAAGPIPAALAGPDGYELVTRERHWQPMFAFPTC